MDRTSLIFSGAPLILSTKFCAARNRAISRLSSQPSSTSTNRIGAVLATLGVSDYNPLLRNRYRRLAELRTGLDEPLPPNARAKIERLLARLELVLTQIAKLERERDAVVESDASDTASKMIQQLARLAWHRYSERDSAGARSVCPTVRQWQGTRLICWSGFLTIQ